MNYEYSEFTLIAVTAMAVMRAHTEENMVMVDMLALSQEGEPQIYRAI